MNKKIGIILVFVLLVCAVFLSACQQEVGGRINRNIVDGGEDIIYKSESVRTSDLDCPCEDGSICTGSGTTTSNDEGGYVLVVDCTCCPSGASK